MATAQAIRTVAQRLWQTKHRQRFQPAARPALNLTEALQRECYRRGFVPVVPIEQYRTEGQWITIGGSQSGDVRHAGGTPVRVDGSGRITAGPGGLEGRTMGQVDRDKESPKSQGKADESNNSNRQGEIRNRPNRGTEADQDAGHATSIQGRDGRGEQVLGHNAGGSPATTTDPSQADDNGGSDGKMAARKIVPATASEQPKQQGLFGPLDPESGKPKKPAPSGEKQRAIGFPEESADASRGQRSGVKHLPDGRQVGATTVNVSELKTDPQRFQYKVSGIGAGGVNEELKEVRQYRPEFGGQLLVWHDPADNADYVINGHHRYELASRSPQTETWQGEMNVMFIDAKNAEEARSIGALANIAEGHGTPLDAAKFMRDTGKTAEDMATEGISLKGATADKGAVLSKLSDRTFRKLIDGMIPEGRAIAVARDLQGNPELQDEILKDVEKAEQKKGRTVPDSVVSEMAREAALAPTVEQEVNDLFGSSTEQKNLRVARAEIKSALRQEISAQLAAHRAVTGRGRAERLAETGTAVNVEASKQAAQEAAEQKFYFDKLVNTKGPISELANRYAVEFDAATTQRQRQAIRKRASEEGAKAIQEALRGRVEAFSKAHGRNSGQPGSGRVVRPGRSRVAEHFARAFRMKGWSEPVNYLRELFAMEFARRDRETFAKRKPATGQGSFDWDESKHPRAADGKFGQGGGGNGAKGSTGSSKTVPGPAAKEPEKQPESMPGQKGLFGEDEHKTAPEAPKKNPYVDMFADVGRGRQDTFWAGMKDQAGQGQLFNRDKVGAETMNADVQKALDHLFTSSPNGISDKATRRFLGRWPNLPENDTKAVLTAIATQNARSQESEDASRESLNAEVREASEAWELAAFTLRNLFGEPTKSQRSEAEYFTTKDGRTIRLAQHAGVYDRSMADVDLVVGRWSSLKTKAQVQDALTALNTTHSPQPTTASPGSVTRADALIREPQSPEEMATLFEAVKRHPYYQEAQRRLSEYGPNLTTWSQRQNQDAQGNYTPERSKIHQEIIGRMLNPRAAAPEGTRPKAFFLMGPPAAGKTTAGAPMSKKLGVEFTTINPDDAKAALPEYQGWNAGILHEESSDITEKQLLPQAIAARHNLQFDLTGKNGEKLAQQAEELANRGYDIHICHVKLPSEKAAYRAWMRFRKGAFVTEGEPGRFVDPQYSGVDVDGKPDQTYQRLKSHPAVRSWMQVSTDVPRGQAPQTLDEGQR